MRKLLIPAAMLLLTACQETTTYEAGGVMYHEEDSCIARSMATVYRYDPMLKRNIPQHFWSCDSSVKITVRHNN